MEEKGSPWLSKLGVATETTGVVSECVDWEAPRRWALFKWCINPFPPWDVMTLRSGLRLGAPSWALWVGGGGDLAGTTLFKLLPLATGSRPGEARALT